MRNIVLSTSWEKHLISVFKNFLKYPRILYLLSDMSIGNKLLLLRMVKLRYFVKGQWGIIYYSKGDGIKG